MTVESVSPESWITLHTTQYINDHTERFRVNGGWIYKFFESDVDDEMMLVSTTFVPD